MLHQDAYVGDIHVPYQWIYASDSERLAATGFTINDVGKLCVQVSNSSLWMLTDIAPVWIRVGTNTDGRDTALNELLPNQDQNGGKLLQTDGNVARWVTAPSGTGYSQWPQVKPYVDDGEASQVLAGYQLVIMDEFEIKLNGSMELLPGSTLYIEV